jgi:hypothetical protein
MFRTQPGRAKVPGLIEVRDPADLYLSPEESRAARISAEFREKPAQPKNTVGDAQGLREHILRLSLFPNIYNKLTVRSGF